MLLLSARWLEGRGIEGARWSEGQGVEGVRWSEGRGVEGARWSGVGRSRARGRTSGIWGRDVEGGGSGTEVGGGVEGVGGAEGGQHDGAKPKFTTIRVSRRRGYSSYTRYIIGIG
jgi:hypothetical protein